MVPLAAAYAENGHFDDAVHYQKQALENRTVHAEDRHDYEKRWKLYETKKPYRDE